MAFSISYIFQAIDEYSGVAQTIAGKTAAVRKEVQELSLKLKESSEQVKKLGESFSLYLSTPLVLLGVESLKEFNSAQQAIAQVDAALKSTGDRAGFTSKQLQQVAESIQQHSLFTHTQVLSDVTAQMLRFGHVTGQTFIRAQQAAVDWAARQHVPLSMAALSIGRALENPTRGLMRLSRAGLVFSKEQIKVINTLVETGRLATAQNFILDKLKQKFDGAAEAAAKAGTGPLTQLMNDFKDLEEIIGQMIAEAIIPWVPKIKELIEYLKGLDPHTKKFILDLVGIVAVIGPVLVGIGVLGLAISSIGRAFVALTSPLAWLIISLTTVAYWFYEGYTASKFALFGAGMVGAALITLGLAARFGLGPLGWIVTVIELIAEAFIYAYGHSEAFRKAVDTMVNDTVGAFKWMGAEIDVLLNKIKSLYGEVKRIPIVGSFLQKSANANMITPPGGQNGNGLQNVNLMNNGLGLLGININVNDPNQTIKSVETSKSGVSGPVNVGKNMSRVN